MVEGGEEGTIREAVVPAGGAGYLRLGERLGTEGAGKGAGRYEYVVGQAGGAGRGHPKPTR